MRRTIAAALAFLLTLSLCCVPGASAQDGAQPPPAGITLSADPAGVPPGGTSVLTAAVGDASGQPVPGVRVDFAASAGRVDPASVVTDDQGRATATFTAPREPGQVSVTAQVYGTGLSTNVSVEVLAQQPPAGGGTVESTPGQALGVRVVDDGVYLRPPVDAVHISFDRAAVLADAEKIVFPLPIKEVAFHPAGFDCRLVLDPPLTEPGDYELAVLPGAFKALDNGGTNGEVRAVIRVREPLEPRISYAGRGTVGPHEPLYLEFAEPVRPLVTLGDIASFVLDREVARTDLATHLSEDGRKLYFVSAYFADLIRRGVALPEWLWRPGDPPPIAWEAGEHRLKVRLVGRAMVESQDGRKAWPVYESYAQDPLQDVQLADFTVSPTPPRLVGVAAGALLRDRDDWQSSGVWVAPGEGGVVDLGRWGFNAKLEAVLVFDVPVSIAIPGGTLTQWSRVYGPGGSEGVSFVSTTLWRSDSWYEVRVERECVPFGSGVVETVITQGVIRHCPDTEAAAGEITLRYTRGRAGYNRDAGGGHGWYQPYIPGFEPAQAYRLVWRQPVPFLMPKWHFSDPDTPEWYKKYAGEVDRYEGERMLRPLPGGRAGLAVVGGDGEAGVAVFGPDGLEWSSVPPHENRDEWGAFVNFRPTSNITGNLCANFNRSFYGTTHGSIVREWPAGSYYMACDVYARNDQGFGNGVEIYTSDGSLAWKTVFTRGPYFTPQGFVVYLWANDKGPSWQPLLPTVSRWARLGPGGEEWDAGTDVGLTAPGRDDLDGYTSADFGWNTPNLAWVQVDKQLNDLYRPHLASLPAKLGLEPQYDLVEFVPGSLYALLWNRDENRYELAYYVPAGQPDQPGAEPLRLEVDPPEAAVGVGESTYFTATVFYSDGSTRDVTLEAAWSVSDPLVASISGGLATGLKPGQVGVVAAWQGLEGTGKLNVIGPVCLEVRPAEATVKVGGVQQYRAYLIYSDGSERDVTGECAWSVSDPSVASIGQGAQGGLATGLKAGRVDVVATWQGQS